MRVLVADGDRHIRELLTYNLEHAGYDVASADDGDEALRLAARFRPDLAILDTRLPGLGGDAVCRRIKDNVAVPVVLLSEFDDAPLAYAHGADAFLPKPFSVSGLLARVEALLR
ncbi:MAG: response regulator [Clostridia bacterium]|nr:response regulator [Clostridia bacterium]